MNKEITPYNLDLSKLSPPSKRFLLFRNVYGFRPLLLQPSFSDCYPFKEFNLKKEIRLNQEQQKIDDLIVQLNYEFVLQKIESNKQMLESLQNELKNIGSNPDSIEKRYVLNGEIESIKSFLNQVAKIEKEGVDPKTGKYNYAPLKISGFNEGDPRYQEMIKEKNKLETNFVTWGGKGRCDACGVALPSFIEKHIDFLSGKEVHLCPYCHACEHIDNSDIRGSLSYLPYFSQEQINLFYHAYFLLKHVFEGTKEQLDQEVIVHREYLKLITEKHKEIDSIRLRYQHEIDQHKSLGQLTDDLEKSITQKAKQKEDDVRAEIKKLEHQESTDERLATLRSRKQFMDQRINNAALNFTYGELFNYMTKLDRYFHMGESVLIRYYESKAAVNYDTLKREYEDRIGEDIEDLSKFIQNNNGVFDAVAKNYITQKLFTYNIDSPNSPVFFASFFMKKGLHLQSKLSKEEKLNILTRISGVRYLPNYEYYKLFMESWIDAIKGISFDQVLSDFVSVNIQLFNNDIADYIEDESKSAEESAKNEDKTEEQTENDAKDSVKENASETKPVTEESDTNNEEPADNTEKPVSHADIDNEQTASMTIENQNEIFDSNGLSDEEIAALTEEVDNQAFLDEQIEDYKDVDDPEFNEEDF